MWDATYCICHSNIELIRFEYFLGLETEYSISESAKVKVPCTSVSHGWTPPLLGPGLYWERYFYLVLQKSIAATSWSFHKPVYNATHITVICNSWSFCYASACTSRFEVPFQRLVLSRVGVWGGFTSWIELCYSTERRQRRQRDGLRILLGISKIGQVITEFQQTNG